MPVLLVPVVLTPSTTSTVLSLVTGALFVPAREVSWWSVGVEWSCDALGVFELGQRDVLEVFHGVVVALEFRADKRRRWRKPASLGCDAVE